MKPRTRATFTSFVVLLVVFGSGVVIGAAVDGAGADGAEVEERRGDGADGRRERGPPMYERVGISDAQRVVIDSLVVHQRTEWREVHRELRAAYDSAWREWVDSTRTAIMSFMEPEQRMRYDSLLTAWDERRRDRERNEGDDGGRDDGDGGERRNE